MRAQTITSDGTVVSSLVPAGGTNTGSKRIINLPADRLRLNRCTVLLAGIMATLALTCSAEAATITRISPTTSSLTLTQGQSQTFQAGFGNLNWPDNWDEAKWYVNDVYRKTENLGGQNDSSSFSYTFTATGTYTIKVHAQYEYWMLFIPTTHWTSYIYWYVTVKPPTATVTVCTPSGGTVSPSPGSHTYNKGTSVSIRATPSTCYRFVRWNASGGVSVTSSTSASTTMRVNSSGSLCPVFEKKRYTVTISTPTGGTVSPSPGTRTYDCGASVSIRATPSSGYQFVRWNRTGGVSVTSSTSASTTMKVNGNGTLSAQFERRKVPVPNVIGKTESQARSAITAAGLTVGRVIWTQNNSVPAGQVVGQNPTGGTWVDYGSAVELTVSQGPTAPQTVPVPKVTGMTQSQAQSALASAGLAVGTITKSHSQTVPTGQVISQNPASGSQVPRGSQVNLTISLGPISDDSGSDDGSGGTSGELYTVGKAGIHRISLDGTVEHLLALHKDSYDIEIRDDRLYVTETTRGGDLVAYSLDGDYLTSIPTPAAANDYYKFVALPNRRFALLDNRNDKAFFIDETGSLLATTKLLSTPDSLYQSLSGIVVGNRLILSENGNGQVLAIDLTTYQASVFKTLSHLPQPLSDLAYTGGKYYILAGSRMVYSFTESGSAAKVGETGGVNVTGICILGNFAYISTNSANKVFELNLGTGVASTLASGIHYPRDIECVELTQGNGETGSTGACCGLRPGDRVILMVNTPLDSQGVPATGLYAGTLGTVVCCDYDDPDLPLFVSWDDWTNGKDNDTYCDPPVMSYTPHSGWWMSCDEVSPWGGAGNDGGDTGDGPKIGGSAPVIKIGGSSFSLSPDPSASSSPRTYIGSVQIEVEVNFRARLSAQISPIPAIGGMWSAWLEPAELGPGTVTTTLWVRGEDLDLSAFPAGLTGVQVATITIFAAPVF